MKDITPSNNEALLADDEECKEGDPDCEEVVEDQQ